MLASLILPLLAVAAAEPPRLEPVFEAEILLAANVDVGTTPFGTRNYIPIIGGRVVGAGISAQVLPGGWDWQGHGADGCLRLHANYLLKTDDGTIINIDNSARRCAADAAPGAPLITSPTFEAPLGRYGWLNGGTYVGQLRGGADPAHPSVHIRVFRVR